ncbi:YIP1 family protein [Marinihelvus fidelis]|uniref:YIP1 family protein n=1 Tax=Marinihelvus fidelis TaxID=2613842 RepID=A0A5N0TFW8_9GAMM|nr:Yip1 family protein [Marinihelvus fidelis]KAA9134043.1 YIP1 family protein [Marinihelvus fidelis]
MTENNEENGMEFDINKTVALVKGGVLEPQTTWSEYLADNPGWQKTLFLLTGPLLLANVLLSTLFTWIFGGLSKYAMGDSFIAALLFTLVTAVAGFLLAVFIISALAGVFGGKPSFDRTFAAVSLVAIPAWLAGIVGALIPWVGFLVALAGGIWSLVLLYKIIPLALEVPDDKRVGHYIVSIIAVIICNMILGAVLAFSGLRPGPDLSDIGSRNDGKTSISGDIASGTGIFGQAQRQAELVQAASRDQFEPPSDGKVSEDQVEDLVEVVKKAEAALADRAERLKKISEEVEEGEVKSPGDLMAIYEGMGTAVSLQNVEMEVVKTGGGNWAEYRWVKEQLRVAKLQQGSGSDALEHNFELYKEYEDVLGDLF